VDLLTYADVQKILDNLSEAYKKLIADMVPSQISVGNIQRILQNLIAERVSIRDLSTILEGIFEGSSFSRNLTVITEHVRQRLSRQITLSHTGEGGMLSVVTLSPQWEEEFSQSLSGDNDHKQLSMAPSTLQDFAQRSRSFYENLTLSGESPVLVTSALIRPYVRSVFEKIRSSTIVLSHNEVHPKAKLRSLGQL
jgi:flagellar biosynthesis protein FlhA